jgi:spermidine synthase
VKALSFKKKIRRIGMVGLGGGSIPKYCYRNFPNTDISVAEINSEVIAVRDRFFVPKDDDRFRVHCEDGAEFVARHPAQFDVLFVDGYDEKGQPPQLCDVKFYGDCYRALTLHGMLIVNICDTHEVIPRIQRSFFDRVVLMDSEESCFNTIVVAAKGRTFKALAAQVGSLAMWP